MSPVPSSHCPFQLTGPGHHYWDCYLVPVDPGVWDIPSFSVHIPYNRHIVPGLAWVDIFGDVWGRSIQNSVWPDPGLLLAVS
jgi:hypothetical protein